MRRRRPDALSRTVAIGLVAGRAGIGAAALLAARPALGAIGFDGASPSARVLSRLAGARDLILAGLVVHGLDDRRRLRDATLAALAADAADSAIFLVAGARQPQLRKASALSAPAAIAAVVTEAWLADRLG